MAGRECPDHGPLPVTDAYCPNQSCGKRAAMTAGSMLFGGKYQITRKVAEGGMATIYEATNTLTGDTIAVKEIRVLPDPQDPNKVSDALARFESEAKMLQGINSTHFPAGYDHWDEFGTKFMALEFIDGDDFEQIATAQGGTMTDKDSILRFGIATCEGLEILHALNPQVVHRDIKPANVMQDKTGRIIVMDLGISKKYNPTAGTQTHIGTPGYAALEQECGRAEPRSDLYSAAVSMMRLLLGPKVVALDQDQRLDEIDNLPLPWQGIFRRAAAVEALDRQADVTEFKQDLQGLLPPPAPVTQPLQPRPRPAVVPVVPQPAPAPLTPINIVFDQSMAVWHGHDYYRQPVNGTVYRGTTPVANFQVTPYVLDFGMGIVYTGGREAVIVSDRFGKFSLPSRIITPPAKVSRRRINLKALDPANPAATPTDETFNIDRPITVPPKKGVAPPPTPQPVRVPGQVPVPAQPAQQSTPAINWWGWVLVLVCGLLAVLGGLEKWNYFAALFAYLGLIAYKYANKESWKMTWKQVFMPAISFAYIGVWLALVLTK